VPRDRDASLAPVTVGKRVRRLRGVDEMVISLAARGLSTGDVQAHLAEVYGTSVSRQQISGITDAVVEKMALWQSRPLDAVYPVVFIDAINVKIRDGQVANRPIYVALAVTCDGTGDVLGLWAGEHGDGEGAKYWLRVLSEIKNRGVNDAACFSSLSSTRWAVVSVTVTQTCSPAPRAACNARAPVEPGSGTPAPTTSGSTPRPLLGAR